MQATQGRVGVGHTAEAKALGQLGPAGGAGVTDLLEAEEHMAAVAVERELQAVFTQVADLTQVVEVRAVIMENQVGIRVAIERQRLGHAGDAHMSARVAVEIDHQRTALHGAARTTLGIIGVGKDIVRGAASLESGELAEAGGAREAPALVQQRADLAPMALQQALIGPLVTLGPAELHAVLLGVAFELTVAVHRQAWQGGQQRRYAKVLIIATELVDCRTLVGIVHEVDVAAQDARVERDGLADDLLVLGVLLIAEHVHEGAVVDAVHAQRANEVALHQPEGLRQQQRVWHLGGNAVDDLAPELLWHQAA